jgi:hypothetical protein
MDVIRAAIVEILTEENPASVRQTFYQLVSRGVVEKTEAQYKGTVGRLLVEMRVAGDIPYGWIADSTRWMRKPDTFDSLEDALRITAETYRRALWAAQGVYVEVWLEKDALSGVIYEETARYDVPLMVTSGYPSITYLYEAAQEIASKDVPTFIYYFGDHDPSGVDIPRNVEKQLRRMASAAEIYFDRVAVLPHQIEEMGLQTRPTKRTDSRAHSFEGESVEVDAISPARLREMVAQCITQHIDTDILERTETIEAAERETLARLAEAMA